MHKKLENRNRQKNFKKIEQYNFKHRNDLKNELSSSPAQPVFVEKMLAKWSTLTFEQKIGVVIVSLLAIGLSMVAIYYLLPVISESIKNNPNQRPNILGEKNSDVVPNNSITEIAKNTNIYLQTSFQAELKFRNLDSVRLGYEKQAKMLRKILPKVFNIAMMERVLLNKDFHIELVPENDPTLTGNGPVGPNARYLPLKNVMLIVADTDMIEEEALHILRNEFHHAGVRDTNYKKQSSAIALKREEAFSALRPFIADKWQIDPVLEKAHGVAIEKGLKRIDKFERLLTTSGKMKATFFEENEKEDLKLYLQSIIKYKPMIRREEMPPAIFELFSATFKPLADGRYLAQLENVDYYVQAIQKHSNIVTLHYTFMKSEKPKDKAAVFFADIKSIKEAMGSGYKDYPDSDKSLELSSFIQELEPDVLKTFFPEWCDYFSKYHTVEDYCRNDLA